MFRIGIIGAAKIAHHFVRSAGRIPEVRIAAVASKSAERASAFAKEEGIPASYGSYEEMLEKESPDAVYVATTMNYHYENVKLALEHRIPVLCEKALSESRAQAEELFTLAQERNTFLMEGLWTLFTPKTRKVREWVLSGRIGEANLIQACIGFRAEKNPENRYYSPDLGGGAMLDLGAYMVAVPPYMVGQEIREYGGWTLRGFNGIDEKIFLDMRLDGAVSNVIGSFDTSLPQECLIAGTEGFIRVPNFHAGNEACLYDAGGRLIERFLDTESVGFEHEIGEMIRCVREGRIRSETASPELSLRCAEIFDWFRSR